MVRDLKKKKRGERLEVELSRVKLKINHKNSQNTSAHTVPWRDISDVYASHMG
jgi:hypothetical protein